VDPSDYVHLNRHFQIRKWEYEYVITSIRNGYRYIKIMVLYLSLSENSASMTSSSLPAAPEDGCSAEASAPPAAPAWL
jgi:hypothetical protein